MTDRREKVDLIKLVRFNKNSVRNITSVAKGINNFEVRIDPTVREVNGEYQVIHGQEWVEAALLGGLTDIECVIKELTDVEANYLWFLLNDERSATNPMERAEALQNLVNLNQTQEQIAYKLNLTQAYVSQLLSLLKLSEPNQLLVRNGCLDQSHAELLSSINDVHLQEELGMQSFHEGLSVNQLSNRIKNRKASGKDACNQPSISMTLAECTVKQFFKEILKQYMDKQIEHECDDCKNRKLCGRVAKEADVQLNDEAETPKTPEDKPKLIDLEAPSNQDTETQPSNETQTTKMPEKEPKLINIDI